MAADKGANQNHRNVTVDVRPFWGDAENRQVGITRQDFDIPGEITPSFVLFGSNFTMAPNAWWGDRIVFRLYYGRKNFCFNLFGRTYQFKNVLPFIKPVLFRFDPDQIDGGQFDDEAVAIKNLGKTGVCDDPLLSEKLNDEETDKVDLATHRNGPLKSDLLCYPNTVSDDDILRGNTGEGDLRRATRNEYVDYTEPGQFAYLIPCNRRRMVTDEAGNLTDSDDPSKGVYTEWRGAMLAGMEGEMESPKGRVSAGRVRMRIPQTGNYSPGWITATHLFKAGGYYTTAQFIHKKGGAGFADRPANDFYKTPGYLSTVAPTVLPSYERMTPSDSLLVPQATRGFTGQWLIGALYFIQFAYKTSRRRRRVSEFITSRGSLLGNVQPLGGGLVDTRFLLNVDRETGNGQTVFVELDKADIIALATKRNKSVVLDTPGSAAYPGTGTGKYFFKGLKGADSLKLLLAKNLI